MTLILLYLYYILSQPPGMPAYQTRQLKPLFSIYGFGTKEEQMLYRPTDVSFDTEGNIYIADTGRARILEFRSSGQFIRKIGKKGLNAGELIEPVGVTVAKDGRIFVADKALNKVVVYNNDGRFKREFRVMYPIKPLIANGKLYLTTYGHVITYDLEGRKLSEWAQKGRKEGYVDSPTGIAVNKNGSVYVSDTLNLRLEAFSREGDLLWVKGQPAKDIKAQNRTFGLPCGLTIDDKNRLFLIDAFDNAIRVLNTNGKQIAVLGKEGSREGQLKLPSGIAYDQNGIFAVADKFNDRVQIVKIIIE
jgi:DNA-binding beta-propeller fold protein YncE